MEDFHLVLPSYRIHRGFRVDSELCKSLQKEYEISIDLEVVINIDHY